MSTYLQWPEQQYNLLWFAQFQFINFYDRHIISFQPHLASLYWAANLFRLAYFQLLVSSSSFSVAYPIWSAYFQLITHSDLRALFYTQVNLTSLTLQHSDVADDIIKSHNTKLPYDPYILAGSMLTLYEGINSQTCGWSTQTVASEGQVY